MMISIILGLKLLVIISSFKGNNIWVDCFIVPTLEFHNLHYVSQQQQQHLIRHGQNIDGCHPHHHRHQRQQLIQLHVQHSSNQKKYIPNADIWPLTTTNPNNDQPLSLQDCFPNGIVPPPSTLTSPTTAAAIQQDDESIVSILITRPITKWKYTIQCMIRQPNVLQQQQHHRFYHLRNQRTLLSMITLLYSTIVLIQQRSTFSMLFVIQDVCCIGLVPILYVYLLQRIQRYPIFPPWYETMIQSNNNNTKNSSITNTNIDTTLKLLSLLPSSIIQPLAQFDQREQYRSWKNIGCTITRIIPLLLSLLFTTVLPGGSNIYIGSIWILRYLTITSILDICNTLFINHSIYGITHLSLPIRGIYTVVQSLCTMYYSYQWMIHTCCYPTITASSRSIQHVFYKNTLFLSFVVSLFNFVYNTIQSLFIIVPIQLQQYYHVYYTMIRSKYVELHDNECIKVVGND